MRRLASIVVLLAAGCGPTYIEREMDRWYREHMAWTTFHAVEKAVAENSNKIDTKTRESFLKFQKMHDLYVKGPDPDIVQPNWLKEGEDYLYCPQRGEPYRVRIVECANPMDFTKHNVTWRRVFDDGRLGWHETSTYLCFRRIDRDRTTH